jgi:hypothetical protein
MTSDQLGHTCGERVCPGGPGPNRRAGHTVAGFGPTTLFKFSIIFPIRFQSSKFQNTKQNLPYMQKIPNFASLHVN